MALLAVGIILVQPELKMPAVTKFIDGTGPVLVWQPIPVPVHHHRCGSVSGFHSLSPRHDPENGRE